MYKELNEVYQEALPYYERAKHISPIAHIDIALEFAKEIATKENFNEEEELTLLLAITLHDIGLCDCKLRKIVESEINLAKSEEEKTKLIQSAIEARKEHMDLGAEIAWDILMNNLYSIPFYMVDDVYWIIKRHDQLKICKYTKENFKTHDKILQAHIEADALWMLSKEGIEWDIQRAVKNGLEPMSYEEQLKHNSKVIKDYFKTKTGIEIYNKLKGV